MIVVSTWLRRRGEFLGFVGEPSSGLEAARSVGGRASAGAVAILEIN